MLTDFTNWKTCVIINCQIDLVDSEVFWKQISSFVNIMKCTCPSSDVTAQLFCILFREENYFSYIVYFNFICVNIQQDC